MNSTLKTSAKVFFEDCYKMDVWEASEESDYRRNGNDFEFCDNYNETKFTLESADGWKVLCEDYFVDVNDESGARFVELLDGYEDNIEHEDLTIQQLKEALQDMLDWELVEGEEMSQDTFNERLIIRVS